MYVLCMLRQLFGAVVCTCTRPTPLIGSESYNPHPLSHPPRRLPTDLVYALHPFTRLTEAQLAHKNGSRRLRLVGLAVTTMPLLPVPDHLEATDDLTNAEESKNLSGDDTGAPVLCARCAADLREDGVGVHVVGQLAGVAEGVERGLQVALDGLDGAVARVRNAKWRDVT